LLKLTYIYKLINTFTNLRMLILRSVCMHHSLYALVERSIFGYYDAAQFFNRQHHVLGTR